jgi:hypothetical protein
MSPGTTWAVEWALALVQDGGFAPGVACWLAVRRFRVTYSDVLSALPTTRPAGWRVKDRTCLRPLARPHERQGRALAG